MAEDAKLNAALAEIAGKRNRIQADARDAAERKADLVEKTSADAARALVDEVAVSADTSARRRAEVTKCDEILAGAKTALGMLDGRKAELAAKLAELVPAKADAVVAVVQARRAHPVARIHSALADIAPALTELVATDFVLTDLLGQKFAYDAVKAPDLFSARTVVTRFVDAIPARFAPEQLDGFAIRDAAVEIATRWEKELTTDA
ncbi:hypothetical protein VSX64_19890 [Aurantimonas sp. C2-6-R+9]|uniref:hypothetical protein n=1 Tax=unclassified Aurantimonas TaxID=2638230 RepID=UPI002E1895E1|nr:hypothetical protein [Aurantimonas sp. C2-6-R+9]